MKTRIYLALALLGLAAHDVMIATELRNLRHNLRSCVESYDEEHVAVHRDDIPWTWNDAKDMVLLSSWQHRRPW